MAVPRHIVNYHNTREDLSTEVREDTESILKAIDLDTLLEDPKGYLTILGNEFMNKHTKSFMKALDLGRKHGKALMRA